MYELKKNGKVFTSKFVGTGPSSYEKKNLPCRGLTKVEKHWLGACSCNEVTANGSHICKGYYIFMDSFLWHSNLLIMNINYIHMRPTVFEEKGDLSPRLFGPSLKLVRKVTFTKVQFTGNIIHVTWKFLLFPGWIFWTPKLNFDIWTDISGLWDTCSFSLLISMYYKYVSIYPTTICNEGWKTWLTVKI